MGDVFDQAAAPSNQDVFDTAAKGPSDSNFWKAVKGEDVNVPLDPSSSSTLERLTGLDPSATAQGALNVVSETSKAVQGLGSAIAHPIDTVKGMVSGVKGLPGQVADIPGAIKDINASPDPTGTYLNVAGKTAAQGAGQALTAVATEGLARGVKVAGGKAIAAVKDLKGVPAALSADTSSTLATVAHNEGLAPLTSTTAREAADELSQSFVKRAKDQYGVVDKAVGGDLKPVQERITSLKKAIRAQANVNPDLADKYIEDLAAQQKTLASLVEKAKASGVTNAEDLMAAGDKDYAKGMAMKEVSKGVKTASGVAKSGGHPNPNLFANQVDRLYNKGTLARALGDDGAKAMLDTAKKGLSKAKTAGVVKKAVLAAAAGGAGAAGYTVAKGALSGQ